MCICLQGGVGLATDDVPLTAFVLISMHRALKVYDLGSDTELVTNSDSTETVYC